MNTEEIVVSVVTAWDAEQIAALYRSAGWWETELDPASVIPALFTGSFAVAVAHDGNNRAVGMGRVLSDGVSDGYIQDVVVDPDCRGQGIGKRIVQLLTETCLQAGVAWIALIAEPDTHAFYEPLGFTVMKDYLPMKYEKLPIKNGDKTNDHT
ncbi:GNAT family N-acetyltransferase [Methanogenium sp. S4BF]|uniref:GNAT family N-acetyltransferase n=1 Tax=Methanogenium sp. S4BF TaxID=1789226 RepID=UPI002418022B|nr:GNAT family N-acetyltransferase [Methanogenium sp. S4BF]WFN35060.1 GNAT family N-acetyltransferase [Methanogenium sp. S4BF]